MIFHRFYAILHIGGDEIKKRFFQPIWRFEEIENKLAILEEEGWRLDKIRGFRSFEFMKSQPKTAIYFFTHSMTREKLDMHLIEDTLIQKFNANQIKGDFIEGLSSTSVFRVTKDVDLTEQKSNRDIILQYYLFKKFLLGMISLLLLLLPLLVGAIYNLEKLLSDMNPFYFVIFVSWFILGVGYSFYNLLGFIYQKKKLNRN